MRRSEVTRTRAGLFARGLVLLATTLAGCTGEDYGTVSATPKSSPEVVQANPPKGGAAAPRVPRGPGQAKSLQDATSK